MGELVDVGIVCGFVKDIWDLVLNWKMVPGLGQCP